MVRVSTVTPAERERDHRRLAAQQLAGPPADGVVQVVDRLLAVQAQDLRAARLAFRARTTGLTAVDVDLELERRTLVVTWLNRGTLHLVTSQDYWWLQRLTTPRLATGNARRLAQEGVSPVQADRGVAAIEAAIANDGPMKPCAAARDRGCGRCPGRRTGTGSYSGAVRHQGPDGARADHRG